MIILACDLGGTRLKIGVVREGRVLAQAVVPAHSQEGLAPQLPQLKDAWMRLLGQLGLTSGDCAGVTVAFPSLVDPGSGRVLAEYGKFADAPQLDLRAWAREELGLPLAIENDARMALIGEWQYGAGRDSADLVMITLGTGIGVGVLMGGLLVRGRHGQAAVLGGHTTVRYGGRDCTCGNAGCAEAEASTAFLAEVSADMSAWEASSLRRVVPLDYAHVFEHAAAGDDCAVRLCDHSLRVWSALTVNLIHCFDPDRVILGGGIMGSAAVILPAVREYVRRHAHTPWGEVRVVASELGDDAALVAGTWLGREQF